MGRRGGKGRRGASADPSDAEDGEGAVTATGNKPTDGLNPLETGPAAFVQGFFNKKCEGGLEGVLPPTTLKWITPLEGYWSNGVEKPATLVPEELPTGGNSAALAGVRATNSLRAAYAKEVEKGNHVRFDSYWRLGGGGHRAAGVIPTQQELEQEELHSHPEVLSLIQTCYPSGTQKAANSAVGKAIGDANTAVAGLLSSLVDFTKGPMKATLQQLLDPMSRRTDQEAKRRYDSGVHLYVINYWIAVAFRTCPMVPEALERRNQTWSTLCRGKEETALEWLNTVTRHAQWRGTEPPLDRNTAEFKKKFIAGSSLDYAGTTVMVSLSNAFGANYDAIVAADEDNGVSIESLTRWLELEISLRAFKPRAEKRSASEVEASNKSANNGRSDNGRNHGNGHGNGGSNGHGNGGSNGGNGGNSGGNGRNGQGKRAKTESTQGQQGRTERFTREQRDKLIKEARDTGQVTCFSCGKHGHRSAECPQKAAEGNEHGSPKGSTPNNKSGNGAPKDPKGNGKAGQWNKGGKPAQSMAVLVGAAVAEAMKPLVEVLATQAKASTPKPSAKTVLSVDQAEALRSILDGTQAD